MDKTNPKATPRKGEVKEEEEMVPIIITIIKIISKTKEDKILIRTTNRVSRAIGTPATTREEARAKKINKKIIIKNMIKKKIIIRTSITRPED